MRRWVVGVWGALAGCSGMSQSGSEEGGADGCGFLEPDDLPAATDGILGDGHQCEQQPYYDPEVPWVTVWYTGDFDVDDCGAVTGREVWHVFPNPLLVDAGMTTCDIVYTVTGSQSDGQLTGDYRLTLVAEVDPAQTTCVAVAGTPLYQGYETMDLVYDVDISEDSGGSAVYFESGNLLGQGWGNASHVNYLSDWTCQAYVVI